MVLGSGARGKGAPGNEWVTQRLACLLAPPAPAQRAVFRDALATIKRAAADTTARGPLSAC